jgi:hypothetical protein
MSTKKIMEEIGGKPILPLGTLGDGTRFEMVGMESRYKNLCVKRGTSGGTYISGMRLTENGWQNLPDAYQISNASPVRIVNEPPKNEEPQQKAQIVEVPEVKAEKKAESTNNGDYKIPSGEFTVKMFCELNNMLPPKAHIYIKEQVEAGTIKNLGTRQSTGRGKPPVWFEKV